MVKVYIRIPNPPDFFPAATESLNADPLGGSRYRLKNSSVFKSGVAYGDIVLAEEGENNVLWFRKVVEKGSYSAIRVASLSFDMDEFVAVLERTAHLGAGVSMHQDFGVALVTIPPEVSYSDVVAILQDLPRGRVAIKQLSRRHERAPR